MTATFWELAFYAGAIFILFITPGPVWLAVTARALSGGFRSAWPLALGVVVGDIIWPLLAILGVSWIVGVYGGFLVLLKWVAALMFLVMGALLFRHADHAISTNSKLTKPGMVAGFVAGLIAIMSNPKAILFYMGVLPGFFDLAEITQWDVVAIVLISTIVPFLGNLMLAAFFARIRQLLQKPEQLKRLNQASGVMLICVGALIPFVA